MASRLIRHGRTISSDLSLVVVKNFKPSLHLSQSDARKGTYSAFILFPDVTNTLILGVQITFSF